MRPEFVSPTSRTGVAQRRRAVARTASRNGYLRPADAVGHVHHAQGERLGRQHRRQQPAARLAGRAGEAEPAQRPARGQQQAVDPGPRRDPRSSTGGRARAGPGRGPAPRWAACRGTRPARPRPLPTRRSAARWRRRARRPRADVPEDDPHPELALLVEPDLLEAAAVVGDLVRDRGSSRTASARSDRRASPWSAGPRPPRASSGSARRAPRRFCGSVSCDCWSIRRMTCSLQ